MAHKKVSANGVLNVQTGGSKREFRLYKQSKVQSILKKLPCS